MDAETGRVNPFMDRGRWYWRGETQNINGPYTTQVEALRAVLRHCDKRTRWEKVIALVWELIHS